MQKLHVDIESWSPIDLKKAGLYRYAVEVEILWLSYKYNRSPVRTIDCYHNEIPQRFIDDLQDPNIIKISHNAPFEIVNLSIALGVYLDPAQWRCTMGLCAMAGLPLSLDESTRILGVAEKDPMGTKYINLFSKPCKPTKKNGMRTRNLPHHFPEEWQQYGVYNARDVVAEASLDDVLELIEVSDYEREVWALDQQINNRGIRIDRQLVRNAIQMNIDFRETLTKEAIEITGLIKPNSVKALKAWIEEEVDEEIENLQKKNIPKLIERFDNETVKRVLNIREQLSKTSVSKYTKMELAVLKNGRIKGLFQYCGAGRTWRFAGRLVQLQNLVKGKYHYHKDIDFDDLDFARMLLLNNEVEMLELLYGPIPDTLSQLMRTAIIPAKGKKFAILDFASIEARILAWLADERWRMEVFNTHGKIYEASAAKILRKPIEKVTSEERSKIGKVSELAAGYAGGVNAYIKMGALEAGLLESELEPIKTAWRTENPNIVKLWAAANKAAIRAINTGSTVKLSDIKKDGIPLVLDNHGIEFSFKKKYLMIKLPSGHSLYYFNASLIPGKYGVQIQYWGLDQTRGKWCRMRTYGGKLIENICQAIGRDCLVHGMLNLDKAGFDISLHVHDEAALEVELNAGEEEMLQIENLFCKKASWMRGLPLRAKGFYSSYYKKD